MRQRRSTLSLSHSCDNIQHAGNSRQEFSQIHAKLLPILSYRSRIVNPIFIFIKQLIPDII
jgi:hypothetical protein